MAPRKDGNGAVRSNVRARNIRDYHSRIRELTEAFNLPDDVREWVTVRVDPKSPDDTLKYQVVLHAQAGRTVASVEVNGGAELRTTLTRLLAENRDDLHAQLKGDLAVNLMAGITEGPRREPE